MTMSRFIRLAVVTAFLSSLVAHGQALTTAEAKDHVGETATVCGTIASETKATGSRGTPTVINLDQPYPHQVFTVLIWGSDKAAVGTIPETGRVCAKGPITLYRGVPEIVVHKSADLYIPTLSNNRHYTNSDVKAFIPRHIPMAVRQLAPRLFVRMARTASANTDREPVRITAAWRSGYDVTNDLLPRMSNSRRWPKSLA
jgi:hypothetical protein